MRFISPPTRPSCASLIDDLLQNNYGTVMQLQPSWPLQCGRSFCIGMDGSALVEGLQSVAVRSTLLMVAHRAKPAPVTCRSLVRLLPRQAGGYKCVSDATAAAEDGVLDVEEAAPVTASSAAAFSDRWLEPLRSSGVVSVAPTRAVAGPVVCHCVGIGYSRFVAALLRACALHVPHHVFKGRP